MTSVRSVGAAGMAPAQGVRATRPHGVPFSIEAAPRAADVPPAQPVQLIGMLALQEQESIAFRNQASRKQSGKLLDALSRLQAGLLGPAMAPEQELIGLIEALPAAPDPALAAIAAAIRLRARVELAKLEMGQPPTDRTATGVADP
jgi:hypothetical protein